LLRRFLAAGGLLLSSCSSHDDPSAAARQAIIGGKPTDAHEGVVLIRTDRETAVSVCSGSIIAPNLLLTARHCTTAEYPEDDIRCNADGSLDLPSGGQLGESAPPERIHVFTGVNVPASNALPSGEPAARGAAILTTDGPSVCKDDIALVVLDRPVSVATLPLDLAKSAEVAALVNVVGYGITESSPPDEKYSARSERIGVPVRYVGTLPDTFALPRSVCKGDSGGPAIDPETGVVLGVYSLGFPGGNAAECSSENALNYFVQVNRYEELLRSAFEAAGQPFPEPPAPANEGGAGGQAGASTEQVAGEPAGGSSAGEPPVSAPSPAAGNGSEGCSLSGASGQHGPLSALVFGLLAGLLRMCRFRKSRGLRPSR
jgi:V8-like Glu-specific endopeptidase